MQEPRKHISLSLKWGYISELGQSGAVLVSATALSAEEGSPKNHTAVGEGRLGPMDESGVRPGKR